MAPSIESFLTSLKLLRRGQSLAKREVRERERPRASNYDKFTEIDLASPLGKYIVTSSGLTLNQMNPATRGYKSLGENLNNLYISSSSIPFFTFQRNIMQRSMLNVLARSNH